MLRTELVQEKNPNAAGKCFMSPNLKAETQKGTLFYHFSMKKSEMNSPKFDAEHQINFLYGPREEQWVVTDMAIVRVMSLIFGTELVIKRVSSSLHRSCQDNNGS
jgi:hypothetical protein